MFNDKYNIAITGLNTRLFAMDNLDLLSDAELRHRLLQYGT